MSEPGLPNPFEGLFGDLARMLGSLGGQGALNWDMARQFAYWIATEGASEANVDPLERIRLEELLRVADLNVAQATGLSTSATGRVLSVAAVNRGEWTRRALDAWRDLFDTLAGSLSAAEMPSGVDAELAEMGADPTGGLLGSLPQILSPFLMAALAGSMTGHLAQRSFAQYDLPLPWPVTDELLVVPANIDAFAEEWTIPGDDLRLWVCLREVAHHAVLARPHVRARLHELLMQHAGGFQVDGDALASKMGEIDPMRPESFQEALGDPELLLGAVQSERQRVLLPQLEALTVTIEGYVDHVMDQVGARLIGSYGMVSEALRRRRVEDAAGNRYVGKMFGLALDRAAYERGEQFVEGVVERAGDEALAQLWESPRELPTPAEVDAPGLWLARIEIAE